MRDSPERTELERQLVQRPLDKALRRQYAQVLMDIGAWEDASIQFHLLMEAAPEQAEHVLQAARCALYLKQKRQALELYARAKSLSDFRIDPELQAASEEERAPVRLHAVSGNVPDNVVTLVRKPESGIGFNDVAGMDDLKKTLRMQIIEPFRNPGLFARFSRKAGGGVLLYGPPGCGKTMMARAIATECRATFMAVGLTDILSLWLGESERNLAALFEKARGSKPAVLFFDELDALAFSRSKAQSEHTRKLVNEFLAQLDGFTQGNDEVMILAATNMPWDIDAAIKRPGRFSKQVFVPPPDRTARARMFQLKLDGLPCDALDYDELAALSEYCSGADIDGIVDTAKDAVLSDIIHGASDRTIRQEDLRNACEQAVPSTFDWLRTAQNLVRYGGVDRSYKEVEAYLKSTNFQ
jgi:transitional endoplasmic reticulum ATPase